MFLVEKVLKQQGMDEETVLLITSAIGAVLNYFLEDQNQTTDETILARSAVLGTLCAGGGHLFCDLLPELLA